ncbi:MAG TPA: dihydrodipicolinate synthase family protein [Chthoniobacteraceae bacterium]|jgi:dihydrodipicolinate synthase/N-acetylneuraminate lyase
MDATELRRALLRGLVIPATPLALNESRRLDSPRQRALVRYYAAAGVGGLAVGVHTTQFAIRDPKVGLYEPLLQLVGEELDIADAFRAEPLVRIAGVCGSTEQASAEASLAKSHDWQAVLLSLGGFGDANEDELLAHCRAIGEILPLVGFYLQPAAGGRKLSYAFWRRFAEIEQVVAIKIAPFNRYQTLDVVRAVAEAGREDIALYTGNDDNIVVDLLTPFRFKINGRRIERRIVGGLLGHWAVWTKRAVELHAECRRLVSAAERISQETLRLAVEITDANAAFFDAANGFAGCVPGIHEVLRRQGLMEGTWCLDPQETLSPGQAEEIDRVWGAYPHLNDDAFVAQNLGAWLG